MPHEKIPFRAAYFVYVKEKLIFFHDHHAPWFQRKRFLFHYFLPDNNSVPENPLQMAVCFSPE